MTEIYEVLEWNLGGKFSETPQKIRFKREADMRQAKKNIEDDVDFEIRVKDKNDKSIVMLVPHQSVKQDLVEGKIIFEAEGMK